MTAQRNLFSLRFPANVMRPHKRADTMRLFVLLFSLLLALPAEAAIRVAVFDLSNQSGNGAKEEYSWVGLNVSETLAGKLSEVPGVQTIPRPMWKDFAQKLKFSSSDLLDQKNALRIGGFLGVNTIILGSFTVLEEEINFNFRFVDVDTGTLLRNLNRTSPKDDRLLETLAAFSLEAVEALNHRVIDGEVVALPPEERLEVAEETKEKIQRPPTKNLEVYALFGKGNEANDQNRWEEAISLYRQVLELDEDYAEAWQSLGGVLTNRERLEEAWGVGRNALTIFKERGDERRRGEILNYLGVVMERRGRFEDADELYKESLDIEQKINNEPGIARTLNNLGIIAMNRGRTVAAERLYRDNLEIEKRIGNKPGIAQTLNNLGVLVYSRGQFRNAEEFLQEGLVIKRELGDALSVARSLNNLGIIAVRGGRLKEAEGFYEESLDILREAGDVPGAALALFNLALLGRDQGLKDPPLLQAKEALETFRRIGSPYVDRTESLIQQLESR